MGSFARGLVDITIVKRRPPPLKLTGVFGYYNTHFGGRLPP